MLTVSYRRQSATANPQSNPQPPIRNRQSAIQSAIANPQSNPQSTIRNPQSL